MKYTDEEAEQRASRTEADGYPEHAKLERLNGKNDLIGDFLEWLDEKDIFLCHESDVGSLYPIYLSKEKMIGEYFDVDPMELEREKGRMLDAIRAFSAERKEQENG